MEQKPLIIVMTTAFAPHVGGAEIAVQELLARLGSQFDFVVVTARMDARLQARDTWQGIPVIRVGWGSKFDKLWLLVAGPFHVWRLQRRQHGATALWAVMASYAGAASWLASRMCGVPYALMLQEGDDLPALEWRLGVLRTPFKWIFRDAAAVHAIAPFLADWARHNGARGSVEVIPNGVDAAAFYLADDVRTVLHAHIRAELLIPPDAFVVVTVSRLVKKNGIADLITAIAELPDVHLIIVGDGELRSELVAQADSLGARVQFVGTQSQQDVKKFAAAADVFCRPSLSEGLGIVFLEAMSMGLPVVATRVGGIPFIVADGETGLLVAPHAPPELSAALARVQNDAGLHERLVKNGLAHVKQFEWDSLAPRFAVWLQRALR